MIKIKKINIVKIKIKIRKIKIVRIKCTVVKGGWENIHYNITGKTGPVG